MAQAVRVSAKVVASDFRTAVEGKLSPDRIEAAAIAVEKAVDAAYHQCQYQYHYQLEGNVKDRVLYLETIDGLYKFQGNLPFICGYHNFKGGLTGDKIPTTTTSFFFWTSASGELTNVIFLDAEYHFVCYASDLVTEPRIPEAERVPYFGPGTWSRKTK